MTEDDSENVVSLGARRFNTTDSPSCLSPRDALVKALEEYDRAENKPDHIIVAFGRDDSEEGCSGTRFFQAGSYRHHAQQGLMLETMQMIRESG